ncbi:MAG TPA: FadR/GntR family transcriptional regulator [Paludibacteraceae bacterium]|jgi:GntR family transcriptional repressor for pyruvate dehydrogenase complex|nr:FadR/GntR family transcriptional regulator [Paludibacteraceae bacterium]HOH55626.1 FadR/GntR family transcriptional regulator [Paludibacteraceae bacterium]
MMMEENFIRLMKTRQKSPADEVINKIKELIESGELKPGDRLPAERKLASDFGFGRTHIREALQKLEFYGIVKTLPQSGTILNGLDINSLNGLLSDVLNLQNYDFYSLVETRCILEMNAIRLCAERRTEEDIEAMEKAHQNFVKFHNDEILRVSYDFAFHRTIAEGSHNPVIKSMLMIIIPDILIIYNKERVCNTDPFVVIREHAEMIEAVKMQNEELASSLLYQHLQGVMTLARTKLENLKIKSLSIG